MKLQLAGQRTVELKMDWRQAILSTIASPEVLFLLLLGALAGLGAEISHPGLIFPGVLGTLCLILFLFASQIIPVNWAGVLLVLLAIGLFAAEVKVHSYGLLTIGGLVAMILGAMMLVDSPVPELRVNVLAAGPGDRRLRRLRDRARAARDPGAAPSRDDGRGGAGRHARPGRDGARPRGLGERPGRAAGGRVPTSASAPARRISVVSMDGLALRVRKEA